MYKQIKITSKEMVATKNKNQALLCSTPEHQPDSPSRDSDSICDSDAASPVPFLCTQDGAEGETDVVWNFYTPKSHNTAQPRSKNSTPLSRRSKRSLRPKIIEKQLPKRRAPRASQKKTELFQDLIELNQNLHELITKKPQSNSLVDKQSGSEEDIFTDSSDFSPKHAPRSNSRCLRRNVLSSNLNIPDTETALESDDSMNECLLKASQIVEEKIMQNDTTSAKRTCYEANRKSITGLKSELNKMDQDSMDAILNSIKLESPVLRKVKKNDSTCLNNDSFDNLVGNLNDSTLEQLTQMPVKMVVTNKANVSRKVDWTVKELVVHDGSPMSKSFFGRHNSMPESPSATDNNKPSTSGMSFGRFNTMPYDNHADEITVPGDSPIRCTPDEIKKKHQQAREKLLAKRLLPFTSQQTTQPTSIQQTSTTKKTQFQPKVPSCIINVKNNNIPVHDSKQTSGNNSVDLKLLIEKKRQEALMKLRRRQPQSKML